MNAKVYVLAALLVASAAGLTTAKVIYGGQRISPEYSRHLWRISIAMKIQGKNQRANVRLMLPKTSERQIIYNEHFENDELNFTVRARAKTGNTVGFWSTELLDREKSLSYTSSVQLKSMTYDIPLDLQIPKEPKKYYPPDIQVWLDPSKYIQSNDPAFLNFLKKAAGKEKNIAALERKLYDFVRGEVRYRSEKGSKDAKDTLNKLVADCGGQARLFAALNRAAGIPSRLVGGMIITEGVKNITHVWVENYIGGKWIPFDVSNDHFASIPNHYLEIYRGDVALIMHLGLSNFEYFFVINPENMPPVDNPWSLYVLPIHFQRFAKVILLIPIGALVVAFSRTMIGVPTFGTFAPILLALAFREITLWVGLLCLLIIIFFGWILRMILDHLKILVIPRLSIVVTIVVIFVLTMMVTGFHFGFQKILFISTFPMVIMTWTVERFSVLLIEDGTVAAIKSAIGTMAVASATYFLMDWQLLRVYLFAFPEMLLVVMAILLLLGRYTGIRISELGRFSELTKERSKNLL